MDILRYLEEQSKLCRERILKDDEKYQKSSNYYTDTKLNEGRKLDMADKAYYYFSEHTNGVQRTTDPVNYEDSLSKIPFIYNKETYIFMYDAEENTAAFSLNGKRTKFMSLPALIKVFNNKEF